MGTRSFLHPSRRWGPQNTGHSHQWDMTVCGGSSRQERVLGSITDGWQRKASAGIGGEEKKKCIPEGPGWGWGAGRAQGGWEAPILVGEAGGQSFLLTSPQGIKGTVGKNGNEGCFDE